MTELWVKKLPTDVHRLIDNKLPEGSKCTGVAMTALDDGTVEEYVATINGQEVIVQGPAEESADDVAAALVELAPPAPELPPELSYTGAQAEGEDNPTETQAEPAEEEYEYDDSEEDDEDEVADQEWGTEVKPKKPKTKTKKKK